MKREINTHAQKLHDESKKSIERARGGYIGNQQEYLTDWEITKRSDDVARQVKQTASLVSGHEPVRERNGKLWSADIRNRVITWRARSPIPPHNMLTDDEVLYLIAHEAGHLDYTTEFTSAEDIVQDRSRAEKMHRLVNAVEDIRINRLLADRFHGYEPLRHALDSKGIAMWTTLAEGEGLSLLDQVWVNWFCIENGLKLVGSEESQALAEELWDEINDITKSPSTQVLANRLDPIFRRLEDPPEPPNGNSGQDDQEKAEGKGDQGGSGKANEPKGPSESDDDDKEEKQGGGGSGQGGEGEGEQQQSGGSGGDDEQDDEGGSGGDQPADDQGQDHEDQQGENSPPSDQEEQDDPDDADQGDDGVDDAPQHPQQYLGSGSMSLDELRDSMLNDAQGEAATDLRSDKDSEANAQYQTGQEDKNTDAPSAMSSGGQAAGTQPGVFDYADSPDWREACMRMRPHILKLTRQLQSALRHNAMEGTSRGNRRGQFDASRAYTSLNGNPNIFKKRNVPGGLAYDFGVLVDVSGSQSRRAKQITDATVLITESLDKCDGINTMVMPWETMVRMKKGFADPLNRCTAKLGRIIRNPTGGTTEWKALRAAEDEFKSVRRYGTTQVAIVITDGSTTEREGSIEMTRRLKSEGVHVIGIGVGKDCPVPDHHEIAYMVEDAHELTELLPKIVRQYVKKGA